MHVGIKIFFAFKDRGRDQVVECLPSKFKVLSSNSIIAKIMFLKFLLIFLLGEGDHTWSKPHIVNA
jgi:hypothetical protein